MRQHLRNIGLIFALSFNSMAYADRYDSCDGDCTGAGLILLFKVAISLALIYFIGSKVLNALLWLLGQNSFFENFVYTTLIFGFTIGPFAYGITGSATFGIFIAVVICFLLSFKTDFAGGKQTSKSEITDINPTEKDIETSPPVDGPLQEVLKFDSDADEKQVYNNDVLDYVGESNQREIVRLNNPKLALVTDLDIDVFGADIIGVCRKAVEESKHIKNPVLLYELPSKYLTEEDEETFGGDMVYLARRIVKDVKIRNALSMREPTASKLVFEFDEEQFGSDLVDLFYRIAREELSERY